MLRVSQQEIKQQSLEHPRYTVTLNGSQITVAVYGVVEFLRVHPVARAVVATLGVILTIAGVAAFLGLDIPSIGIVHRPSGGAMLIAALALLWTATVSGTEFALAFPAEEASKERLQAEQRFAESSSPEDAVNVDLKRLNEYYLINQSQARSSFRWAVISMCIGLGTIIAGIWMFYFRENQHDSFMTGLSTAAGCVVNIVSVLFLSLHSKTQDRSLYYYQQLAAMQKLFLAIRLLDAVPELGEKKTARDMVIKELLAMSREGARGNGRQASLRSRSSAGPRQRQSKARDSEEAAS